VSRPDILGFEEALRVPWQQLSGQELEDELYGTLIEGHSAKAFGLIHGPFLAGRPLAWILDGPVCAAMHRMGELWKHRGDGILLEHRATDICVQAVMRIRLSLPADMDAPQAMGGAGPGDPYMLPTLMAATILRDLGMNDTNLGPETPLAVLRAAVDRFSPRLVWMSVSVEQVAEAIRPELLKFAEEMAVRNASLIIGGRAVEKLADLRHPNLTIGHSMSELSTFARGLLAPMRQHQGNAAQNLKGPS
jgi:methanogenic corrinoid protein MtbC1